MCYITQQERKQNKKREETGSKISPLSSSAGSVIGQSPLNSPPQLMPGVPDTSWSPIFLVHLFVTMLLTIYSCIDVKMICYLSIFCIILFMSQELSSLCEATKRTPCGLLQMSRAMPMYFCQFVSASVMHTNIIFHSK